MNIYLVFSTIFFWEIRLWDINQGTYTCRVKIGDIVYGKEEMPEMNEGAWFDLYNCTLVVRI